MKALKPVPKGQFLIITALSLVVLIGAVGLVIDAGMGYLIRAKLNGAVDAAGIAAARNLPQGETAAMNAAQRFFNANYPEGWLASDPNLDSVSFTRDSDTGRTYIDISATATKKVSLMAVLGFDWMNVRSAAQVVRKDVDMVLVLDVTDSIVTPDSRVGIMLKSRAKEFLAKFNTSNDRASLLHFAYGAVVDVPFSGARGFKRCRTSEPIDPRPTSCDSDSMYYKIDQDAWCDDTLGSCAGGSAPPGLTFSGFTNYSEGMWQARDQLNNPSYIPTAQRSPLRVIVFFSDGSPNTFASYFAFQSPASCSNQPGAIATGAGTTGTPHGMYRYDRQEANVSGCNWSSITSHLTSTALPNYYNAHNINDQEFPVITNTPRVVTDNTSSTTNTWRNVNRAARNLGESMAAKSRSEGIYVFTLGLGAHLDQGTGPDDENGDIVLKCMANVPNDPVGTGCPRYDPNSLKGLYCWARNPEDMGPCFDKMAAEILRLSK